MSEVKVICPNHGIIKRIEMDCMWVGRAPMPEIENAFCPMCGAKTVIERPKRMKSHWDCYSSKPVDDDNDYKEAEIKFYREKYKDDFKLK